MSSGLAHALALAELIPSYVDLRTSHPLIPAHRIVEYIKHGEGESFDQFCCPGHQWVYTGTAYGGDDERWHGEGRCYCSNCGADGDA
jgi:hypothetical protein